MTPNSHRAQSVKHALGVVRRPTRSFEDGFTIGARF